MKHFTLVGPKNKKDFTRTRCIKCGEHYHILNVVLQRFRNHNKPFKCGSCEYEERIPFVKIIPKKIN